MIRKALLLSIGWLCLVAVGPAAAQDYTPPTMSVSDITPVPGQTITVSGAGFPESTVISVALNPTVETTSDASGAWAVSLTIPTDLALGIHTLTASVDGVPVASATITVVAPPGAATPDDAAPAVTAPSVPRLPVTGSGVSILARAGVALAGAGGVFLAVSRHRRNRSANPAA